MTHTQHTAGAEAALDDLASLARTALDDAEGLPEGALPAGEGYEADWLVEPGRSLIGDQIAAALDHLDGAIDGLKGDEA